MGFHSGFKGLILFTGRILCFVDRVSRFSSCK